MIAVLSDIHANLEALEAVLADAEDQGAVHFFCLGDLVGYGPSPKEVVDRIMSFDVVIRGNHDEALVRRIPNTFREMVARSILWTRNRLRPKAFSGASFRKRWRWLKKRPLALRVERLLLAHGSPTDSFEYVQTDSQFRRIFKRDMDEGERICLLGHTHVPRIVVERRAPKPLKEVDVIPDRWYRLGRRRAILNVGSVGQPRDGDPRACYLLLEPGGRFRFRRVPYDIERTSEKILKTRGLGDTFADRLFRGE